MPRKMHEIRPLRENTLRNPGNPRNTGRLSSLYQFVMLCVSETLDKILIF